MVQFRKTLIFPTDFNDLMHLRGQLGVTLGSIFMKIMEDNGRKVKNGPPKRHVDVSVPNGSINKLYSFLRRILLVQDGPEDARAANYRASRATFGHFGVIRASLLDTLG